MLRREDRDQRAEDQSGDEAADVCRIVNARYAAPKIRL